MSIELPSELERRIFEAVESGRYPSVEALVANAVERLLSAAPAKGNGPFRSLRKEIEESGQPLLSDEEFELELRSRRGSKS